MLDLAQPTIAFQRLPPPEVELTFPPRWPSPDPRKRGRAAADVDGEHSCLQKKKRRLRLFLITSRLSPQFSHPATNIVDRGSSKIAVWAKQKAVGRNLLRKAAILNRIRRRAVSAREAVSGRGRLLVEQEKEQRQLEMARLTFNYGSIDTYTRPVHLQTQSVPPSAAVRNGSHYLISGSATGSPSGSPNASRSPSPTSISPPLHNSPFDDNPSEHRSPNAAYALSPPRTQLSTRTYEPHLPSPLGLSNYDAFDAEDPGAQDSTHTDLYSLLDEDDETDRYSYLWDEEEDERHDSPFSPSVVTNHSSTTATTRTSQVLNTPPQHAYDAFHVDVAGALFGGAEEDECADSVWPSPFLGAEGTTSTKELLTKASTKSGYSTVTPNFRPCYQGPLAVSYPGAPVFEAQSPPAVTAPPVKVDLVPASMSPNFLPADEVVWARDGSGGAKRGGS